MACRDLGIHLHHVPDSHHAAGIEHLHGCDKTWLVAFGAESAPVGYVGRASVLPPGASWPSWRYLAADRDRRALGMSVATRAEAVGLVQWAPRSNPTL